MKIALCLHGMFDSLTDCKSKGVDGFNHIKSRILDKGNVDVYIHSWSLDNRDKIIELYRPKKYVFEQQKDFSDVINSRNLNSLSGYPRSPHSVLSHFYSISESFKLLYENGDSKYDLVVKARFDLGRINRHTSGPGKINPYPVQCINILDDIQPNRLYTAFWEYFDMGPADMWFYGDHGVMKNFASLYNSFENDFYLYGDFYNFARLIENNPGNLSNAIAYYKYWMIKNKIWDDKITIYTEED